MKRNKTLNRGTKFMKKLILSIFSLVCLLAISPATHALVDNTLCTVTHDNDDSSLGSLRRNLDQGYNRTQNRSCTEVITFGSGTFNIKPSSTLGITNANDVEFTDANHPSDGANLTINKGQAIAVTIDATEEGFNAEDCVIDVKNPNVKIEGITIKAKSRNKAICGTLNSGSNVTICVGNDCRPIGAVCNPNSTCCDANGQYASAGSSCTDSNGASGTCGGSNTTCTPQPATECDPTTNSQCCDNTGHWKPESSPCDDGDASTATSTCNAQHECVGTSTPPQDCPPNSECCDNTGHYSPVGTPCTTGGEAGACSAAHTCDMTNPPVCGNSAVETGEQCDDGNTTAGDGCDNNCQNETATPTCGNGTVEAPEVCDGVCCKTDCSDYEAAGTACTSGGNSGTCNATTHACDVASTPPPGGTVTPPGGSTTPPPGGTTPDNSNTTPINLGGGGSGGCVLNGSLTSLAPFWMLILGLMPIVTIRRKK